MPLSDQSLIYCIIKAPTCIIEYCSYKLYGAPGYDADDAVNIWCASYSNVAS